METFIEAINQKFAAGYAVLVQLHGIDLASQEFRLQVFPSDLIVKLEVGVELWKWLAKKLGISLAHSIALISPNGKVLISSQHGDDIKQSCDRLESIWVQTLAQENASLKEQINGMSGNNKSKTREEEVNVQQPTANPRRRSADDWIMNKASSETTPVTTNNTKKNERTNKSESVKSLSSQQPSGNIVSATVTPTLRDSKSTKISVKFSNGAPRKVVDVADASQFTLGDLVSQLSEEVVELVLEYPRQKFNPALTQDGSKTIADLDLGQNPSFTAIVKSRFLRGTGGQNQQQQAFSPFAWMASIVAWIVSLVMAIVDKIKQAFPNAATIQQQQPRVAPSSASGGGGGAAAARLRRVEAQEQQQPKKKPNQYWNGDSTVFESPPDDDGNENENGEKRN